MINFYEYAQCPGCGKTAQGEDEIEINFDIGLLKEASKYLIHGAANVGISMKELSQIIIRR